MKKLKEQEILRVCSSDPWQYCELSNEGIFANTGHVMSRENLSNIQFSTGCWHISLNLVIM